jgi:hypothetical protein
MMEKDNIDLNEIDNPFEKKIIAFLKNKKKCIYGEIIRELKIPTQRGQEAIYSLLNKGVVQHINKSSYIELSAEME